jgi:hypothetical protein
MTLCYNTVTGYAGQIIDGRIYVSQQEAILRDTEETIGQLSMLPITEISLVLGQRAGFDANITKAILYAAKVITDHQREIEYARLVAEPKTSQAAESVHA